MRGAIALLVLANLALGWAVTRTERDLEALSERKETLSGRLAGTESTRAERAALLALLDAYDERARSGEESVELGIAGLRDAMLGAERGLGLERLSLEFRPEADVAGGFGGSRIQASLRGSYGAVYRYLGRLEALRLPLAPAELTLREEADGLVALSARWVAAWPAEGAGSRLAALSTEQIAGLSRWLSRDEGVGPGRDVFRPALANSGPSPGAASPEPRRSVPEPAPTPRPPPPPERPELTGFVIARPELEPDVNRRVLAAIRFEGTLHLVGVGDVVGRFRVEAIDSRESVTLGDTVTGETLRLRLD